VFAFVCCILTWCALLLMCLPLAACPAVVLLVGPCSYWLVCSKHMFQTRLLLFARADVVPSISSISSAYEATGIGQ
jgi:hypothetical protein